MSVDKDFMLAALLQHNFLPMQKKNRESLPPTFSSVTFTSDVARKLVAGKQREARNYQGYDAVDYKLTRFNGVSRSCSIPHPTAYAHLALCIHGCWDKLDYICSNKNSVSRPRQHKDGRLIIMNYERSFETTRRTLQNAFGRRFMVCTDIANCFPSIYSHAISWATVGFEYAKKYKPPKYKSEWFNQLDEKVRWLKRNETQGVAIGPATSNIVFEAILAKVDHEMRKFKFSRAIDNYTCFCLTEDDAQQFVRQLAEELAKYNLLLNINKTKIIPLPQAIGDSWKAELVPRLPKSNKSDKISGGDAVNYLNAAVQLAKDNPEGSVLKYALTCLLGKLIQFTPEANANVLQYVLALSFHRPVLLPFLERLFEATLSSGSFLYGDELQQLALENAKFRRSDGIAWALYYLNKYKVGINEDTVKEILQSSDCLALLLLCLSGEATYQARVINFVDGLDRNDLYKLDQYWLLLYELYREGKIADPYNNEDTFRILKDNGTSFLNLVTTT